MMNSLVSFRCFYRFYFLELLRLDTEIIYEYSFHVLMSKGPVYCKKKIIYLSKKKLSSGYMLTYEVMLVVVLIK